MMPPLRKELGPVAIASRNRSLFAVAPGGAVRRRMKKIASRTDFCQLRGKRRRRDKETRNALTICSPYPLNSNRRRIFISIMPSDEPKSSAAAAFILHGPLARLSRRPSPAVLSFRPDQSIRHMAEVLGIPASEIGRTLVDGESWSIPLKSLGTSL